MKLFRQVFFLALLALAGALAMQVLIDDPGFVLVRYRGYDIETTVAGGVLLLGLLLCALGVLWMLARLPFRAWRRYRARQARTRFGDGLDALHRGRYAQAEPMLVAAAQESRLATPAWIAASEAALARGDRDAALAHLQRIGNDDTRAIAEADLAAREGRAADVLALLTPLVAASPERRDAPAPRALALHADALAALGRHAEARAALAAMRRQQALPDTALAERERAWTLLALRDAVDADALGELWDGLPETLRQTPEVVLAHADRACELRWEDTAEVAIAHALDARWDEALAARYGALPTSRPDPAVLERRRLRAAAWLDAHPASPGALLGLARILLAQGQWPQAEPLLHRAIAQGAGGPAWESLGDGFARDGDDSRARLCYANALRCARGDAAEALPGRDLRERILAEAAIEDRDAHGLPRLRG